MTAAEQTRRATAAAKAMSSEQVAYMVAKVLYDAAEADRKSKEKTWLVAHGVKNQDGTTPDTLWAYDGSEEEFDRICTAFENDVFMTAAAKHVDEACETLRTAEDKLIAYGLSIAPANIRDVLQANIRKYDVRQKIIDLTFRLDTSTVEGRK